MEGVLHVDWEPLPGSPQAVSDLRAGRHRARRCSPTPPGRTREDISARLAAMGIAMPADRVVTAASATAAWVAREHPGASVYLLGEQGSAPEFAGLELVARPSQAGVIVVAGPTPDTAYPELDAAFKALMGGAFRSSRCSETAGGRRPPARRWTPAASSPRSSTPPGCRRGWSASLHRGSSRSRSACSAPRPAAVMVGDDLHNDLQPAAALGMQTCLVRTGKGGGLRAGARRGHLRRSPIWPRWPRCCYPDRRNGFPQPPYAPPRRAAPRHFARLALSGALGVSLPENG